MSSTRRDEPTGADELAQVVIQLTSGGELVELEKLGCRLCAGEDAAHQFQTNRMPEGLDRTRELAPINRPCRECGGMTLDVT